MGLKWTDFEEKFRVLFFVKNDDAFLCVKMIAEPMAILWKISKEESLLERFSSKESCCHFYLPPVCERTGGFLLKRWVPMEEKSILFQQIKSEN
ncbi:MAG: hypothetical protein IJ242_08110 [Clostridia bacterium]|nr:hypothetical protein [Clostridia bacterium]